jgi:hypothetical protein
MPHNCGSRSACVWRITNFSSRPAKASRRTSAISGSASSLRSFRSAASIWWLMKDEDKLVVAVPAFYEKNHEAYLTDEGRLKARVNRCAQEAVAFLESRKRARKGLKLHA